MHITAQVFATIAYAFYPAFFIASIMGLGGPDANNDIKGLETLRFILAYPIAISALFLLFGSTYLGIKGTYLVVISILIWYAATQALGLNAGISNLKKGINNSGYSVVQGVVYYDAIAINDADAASFYIYAEHESAHTFRHDALAKDKNYLYRYGKIVPLADPNTLEFITEQNNTISGDFLKDRQHVYFHFNVLENADPKTFTAISSAYFDGQGVLSRDKDTFWYNDQAIDDIIPETMGYVTNETVSSFYLRGQGRTSGEFHYYWHGKLIYTSQNSAAKVLSETVIEVDDHLFVNGKLEDPTNEKVLDV